MSLEQRPRVLVVVANGVGVVLVALDRPTHGVDDDQFGTKFESQFKKFLAASFRVESLA